MKTTMQILINGNLKRQPLVLFSLAILCLGAPQLLAAQTYTITDLGTLRGTNSGAYGINNVGQVVGSCWDANGETQAFLWTPSSPNSRTGLLSDLGTPDVKNSRAYGINNIGQVVVTYHWNGPIWSTANTAFLWTPSSPNATNGTFITLPVSVSGIGAGALGINDSGTVVGFQQNRCRNAGCENPTFSPVRWVNGGALLLPGRGEAAAINNAEQVVGASADGDAILWQTNLATVHLAPGYAEGINSFGQVVGSTNPNRAFLWTPIIPNGTNGNFTDLGTLGGWSGANGINAPGEVVGAAEMPNGSSHAFIWRPAVPNGTNGNMTDLNTLIQTGSGWELVSASAINDRGQIAGTGVNPGDQTHAFLLTPSPAARLTSAGKQPNGQIRFTLIGEIGSSYTIQASSNLVNWTAVTNFVSATGTNQFTDAAAPNFDRRFYRAVSP